MVNTQVTAPRMARGAGPKHNGPMPEQTAKAGLASSFDRAADTYERARPGYPDAVVDWLLAPGPRDVLDLGAGTGKLTRALAGRVTSLHAVDPSPNMLAQLRAAVPGALTAIGTGEAIPLPDDSVDAVFAAQAWHWVDPARGVPEMRRVLRPGGYLGLVWNVRDGSVGWVAALSEIMHGSVAEEAVEAGDLPSELGPVERFTTAWRRPFDRQGLLDLVKSRSYVISAPEPERAQILQGVNELLDTHPDLAGRDSWDMPYRTEAFRITVG